MEDGQEPIDSDLLEQLRSLGSAEEPQWFENLLASYLAKFEDRQEEMVRAIGGGDSEALGKIAHSLVGLSAQVGAKRLSGLLRELQGTASTGDLLACSRHFPGIAEEFRRVKVALERDLHAD